MSCNLTEQELWSGLDRNAPEVAEHVAGCPTCQTRAARLRAGIHAVTEGSTPPAPPIPGHVGPYAIRRRLGQGGMGIVYEGQQQTPKRLVAIKVVRGGKHVDEYRVRLFQREAQTLARLKHPSIAAIYEAGCTPEGEHFFAMELVHGVPLKDYVLEQGVARTQRLTLFGRICDAINYAHLRGVIHRDLKPTNILVDPEGNPKILDFGLARITDPDAPLTTTTFDVGRIIGTLPYMSPEEARGNPDEIDVRSDVYALGVILYELMTDQLPYKVKNAALHEAVGVICEEPPKRPSTLDRTLRGDLETIILKALEKERGRRYQSAGALSEDIERYLTDQPILARRASALYQIRKWVVRHRLLVAFALISIVLVSGASLWVDRLGKATLEGVRRNNELLDLYEAVTENGAAEVLHSVSSYDKAEPKYRRALATFQRLQQDDRAASTMLALAGLLTQREEPTDEDLDDAERLLAEALAIFELNPTETLAEQGEALRLLEWLYGPEVWDLPEDLADVQARISVLEAALETSEKEATPPLPQK